jgi:hypothetical protein
MSDFNPMIDILSTDSAPKSSDDDCSAVSSTKKRKRSIVPSNRINRARLLKTMPMYEVKQSKKKPDQQRALDWLSYLAKDRFGEEHALLLAKWGGVKVEHKGTCILCPEDWTYTDSSRLQDVIDVQQLSSRTSTRHLFQHSDYTTTFARAIVWFGDDQWPRTGLELDNFLGCEPFKPKDASHLCHQEHCIVFAHIVYKSPKINLNRKNCCKEAKALRRTKKNISKHCAKHEPPCMLQVCRSS